MIQKKDSISTGGSTRRQPFDGHGSITSFSSTFAASPSPRKKGGMLLRTKGELRGPQVSDRRVSFNEARNRYFLDTSKTQEDIANSWYNGEEYSRFETKTRKLVTTMIAGKAKKAYSKAMEIVYGIATSEKSMSLSQQIEAVMAIGNNLECLGLEYHAVSVMTKDARARRGFLHDVVADFQQDLGCGWDVSEDMKSSCETISRAPVLFAHLLAKAQQFA